MKICVIIPVFNNENTIKNIVLEAKKAIGDNVLVLNDGSTDKTTQKLSEIEGIETYKFHKNRGKGAALRKAFKIALSMGYTHAITIDADGQHSCEWIKMALSECEKYPEKLLVGARTGEIQGENAPKKNLFARNFGNLWIKIYTGFALNDTQSGFRVYPIEKMKNLKFKTTRFEFEQEVLVKSAYGGIELAEFSIPQFYQPRQERVSHYRVFRDSTRISWFFTKTGLSKVREIFIAELKSNNSPNRKALSFALGIFLGIFPIYGFQAAAAIFAATFLKLNRPLAVLGTMISIPPMIPIIVFAAIWCGTIVMPTDATTPSVQILAKLFLENQKEFFMVSGKYFIVGSVFLAAVSSLLSYLIIFLACKTIRRNI